MKKYKKKLFNNKKISWILLEYILAIECLLLIFLLLKDNINIKTTIDDNEIRWNYSIKNGFAEDVCYYSGHISEVLKIPDNINGFPVASIKGRENGLNIFNSRENNVVKEIILPVSLKKIGDNTFKNCTMLEKIEIPESVTTIGMNSFSGCCNIKEINISKNIVNLGKETFEGCSLLKKIVLPIGLKSLGDNCFANCTNLENIDLPESLNILGESTFSYCSSLKEITIPKNIQRIGYSSFISCTNLKMVKMNNGLLSIGNDAFNSCINLQEMILPYSVNSIGSRAFINCTSLDEIKIPSDVVSIERSTFNNCTNLKKVILNEKLEKIEVNAFAGCRSLTNIYIPERVKNIYEYAFFECENLKNIEINKNNKYYLFENGILYNKDKSEIIECISNKESQINLLENTKVIKEGAFRGNGYLKTIYLDKNITKIADSAFADCDKLADIYLDVEKEKVSFATNWNSNTHAYLHDVNCVHEIKQESKNSLEQWGNLTEANCGSDHSFKVEGNIKNMKVRVISDGEFQNSNKVSEIIYPNQDGIYYIYNINRNKKIILEDMNTSGGVTIRYLDTEGNEISDEEHIDGSIGEKYSITAKYISGYQRVQKIDRIQEGILTDDLITISFVYQKVNRTSINLFENQDILLYIIIILSNILLNLIIYLIIDRKRK